MIPATIYDSVHGGRGVRVNEFNTLVVGNLDFSTPVARSLTDISVPVNFIMPSPDQSIIITDILIGAKRSVPVNGVEVDIYESDAADSLTIIEDIWPLDLARQQRADITGLNLRIPPGRFVNAIADGVVVDITIMFYRAPIKD